MRGWTENVLVKAESESNATSPSPAAGDREKSDVESSAAKETVQKNQKRINVQTVRSVMFEDLD